MNSSTNTLRGLRVMVTRPQPQASRLAGLIEHHGGVPVIYPVTSIEPPANPQQRDRILQSLDDFDIAIFISPTAVAKTLELIESLPAGIQVAAIGSSTENALQQYNIETTIRPDGHDSEALLRHPALQAEQLAEKSIVIFRGEGGRELLRDTLLLRGANVEYAEIYRRARNQRLAPLGRQLLDTVDVIAVTSNDGLRNLYELAEEGTLLHQLPLLVPSERCRQLAEELGFKHIKRSANATDAACIDALREWPGSNR